MHCMHVALTSVEMTVRKMGGSMQCMPYQIDGLERQWNGDAGHEGASHLWQGWWMLFYFHI